MKRKELAVALAASVQRALLSQQHAAVENFQRSLFEQSMEIHLQQNALCLSTGHTL